MSLSLSYEKVQPLPYPSDQVTARSFKKKKRSQLASGTDAVHRPLVTVFPLRHACLLKQARGHQRRIGIY